MPTPQKSFRVPDDVWNAALNRARQEGLSLTEVLVAFLKGYGS